MIHDYSTEIFHLVLEQYYLLKVQIHKFEKLIKEVNLDLFFPTVFSI